MDLQHKACYSLSMWTDMDIGLEKSRVVWKDLGSRRIGKSLEMELGLGDDVKGQGFLMVHT